MSDLIQATSRQVKTMVDGTLRLTVDISPLNAQAAFALFGMPDAPVVLARLTQEAALQNAQTETILEAEIKGGFLSQWLAVRCQEPNFWRFIEYCRGIKSGCINSIQSCDKELKNYLDIESKKEIDNDEEIKKRFHELIRLPYLDWGLKGVA